MLKSSTIKKVLPGIAVGGVLILSYLVPTTGQILGSLVGYGYGTFERGQCCTKGVGTDTGPAPGEDVFIQGNDNAIWQNHWNGLGFAGFTQLFGGTPTAPGASHSATSTNVFIQGLDGQLYQKRKTSGAFSGWTSMGGVLTSGPGVNVRATATPSIDIFVSGSDGALYYRTSGDDGATFSGFNTLGGVVVDNPGSVAWSAIRIDVFIRGQDNALWHKWWDSATGWSGWQSLGGILSSGPAAASCAAGHLDVIVRGQDGKTFYQMGFNGSSWSGWAALNGQWASAPTAVCSNTSAGTVDIFGEGEDNYIYWISQAAH